MDFSGLAELGLLQLSGRLSSNEISLAEYYRWLEDQVEARDEQIRALLPEPDRASRLGREIEALIERFPDVTDRPPLFGIPVGVKDIFHTQGFDTHGGSKLPPRVLRGKEAVSVGRLKDAGAVVFAKTVTTEFAYFAPGPTRNPHMFDHTPGGSSSGSAAAVAAGMLPLTLGTQTIGSIVRPAAFCGVVGFKPTYERISRSGVIPLAESLDHVGFFTKKVEDTELAASILIEDWAPAGMTNGLTLGIPEGPYLRNVSDEGLDNFEDVQTRLERAGCELKHISVMADFEDIRERHNRILAAEAAKIHQQWFSEYEELYHPKTAELIRKGQQVSREELHSALRGRERLRIELEEAAKMEGIDMWISPSAPGVAPKGLDSTGDPVMNLPWTHSGLPSLGLPSGYNQEGLPFGIQAVGSWFGDESLLSMARELERVLGFE